MSYIHITPKACISSIPQGIAYHPSENEYISLSDEHIIIAKGDAAYG